MSIFALNFQFDLQETGGPSNWLSLQPLPPIDAKVKHQRRQDHANSIVLTEKKKIEDKERKAE